MIKCKIEIYTHFFKVSQIHPSMYLLLRKAFDELTQVSFMKIRGHFKKSKTRIYVAKGADGGYRFHINYLPRFKQLLNDNLINYESEEEVIWVRHPVYTPYEPEGSLAMPSTVALRDYQQEAVDYILSEGYSKLITIYTGGGKQLDNFTPIKVPNGWKLIKDLQLGDVVNAPNGDSAKVIGIYDHDDRRCFKITFEDGRDIICGEDHLWEVFSYEFHFKDKNNEWQCGEYRTLTTLELLDFYNYQKWLQTSRGIPEDRVRLRLHIPLVDPTHSADNKIPLPIDPYLLGVILGDGTIHENGYTAITKPDTFVFDEVKRLSEELNAQPIVRAKSYCKTTGREKCLTYGLSRIDTNKPNYLSDYLVQFNLNGKCSWEKFIPEIYMNASFDQRLALIQGLMDTDGFITDPQTTIGRNGKRGNGGGIDYATTSEVLALQMQELLRSVGCIVKLRERQTYYTWKGERKPGRISYRLNIRAQIPSKLFRTPVKQQHCRDYNQYSVKGLKLRIRTIEEVNSVPSRCITVDHPDALYIAKDYICTHNTFTALSVSEHLNHRVMIVVLGRYVSKWIEDVQGAYGKNCNLCVIKGMSHLAQLLDLAKTKGRSALPDVFILTTTVLGNYIKEWEEHAGMQMDGMVPPEEIYETLGIGYRIVDEAHQHYHAVFKSDLYTHCPKTLYLTATLDTNDRFQNFIYQLMWPQHMRGKALTPPKYDETYALTYTHLHPERIRWKGQQGYSHVIYEQSIWKHIPSKCQYLDMIGDQVENWFKPIYEPGKKMLIFCALVDTCIDVAKYLSIRFKEMNWQISKFTAEDPKSIIDTNDITVSTLGKAGTALDVSGLVVCLMTNALAEPKANKQAKGRLRDLSKKPGFEHIVPKFLYFVATDLDKPLQYHLEKKQLFAPLTLKHVEQNIGHQIGKPMQEYLNFGKQGNWEAWGVDPNAKPKPLPPAKSNKPNHYGGNKGNAQRKPFKPYWLKQY